MPRKGRDNYRTWMPIYWGEYLTDTMHFTRAEHGSYLLLIAYYWCNRGLPHDEEEIRLIAKCPKREWPALRHKLASKFEIEFDYSIQNVVWKHARCISELAQAFENKQRADHTLPNLTLSKKEPREQTHFSPIRNGKKSVQQAAREYLAEIEADERREQMNGQEISSNQRH